MEETIDRSLEHPGLVLGSNGLKLLRSAIDNGTKEVKYFLEEECDIIMECKICRNLFRSLTNFIAHKRFYCKDLCQSKWNYESCTRPSEVCLKYSNMDKEDLALSVMNSNVQPSQRQHESFQWEPVARPCAWDPDSFGLCSKDSASIQGKRVSIIANILNSEPPIRTSHQGSPVRMSAGDGSGLQLVIGKIQSTPNAVSQTLSREGGNVPVDLSDRYELKRRQTTVVEPEAVPMGSIRDIRMMRRARQAHYLVPPLSPVKTLIKSRPVRVAVTKEQVKIMKNLQDLSCFVSIKALKCHLCGENHCSKEDLYRHLQQEHAQLILSCYVCIYCKKVSETQEEFTDHLTDVHKKSEQELHFVLDKVEKQQMKFSNSLSLDDETDTGDLRNEPVIQDEESVLAEDESRESDATSSGPTEASMFPSFEHSPTSSISPKDEEIMYGDGTSLDMLDELKDMKDKSEGAHRPQRNRKRKLLGDDFLDEQRAKRLERVDRGAYPNYPLTNEMKEMMDESKNGCRACGKAFQNMHNLRRHVIKHLGWIRFQCKICHRGQFLKSETRYHIRSVHGKEEEAEIDENIMCLVSADAPYQIRPPRRSSGRAVKMVGEDVNDSSNSGGTPRKSGRMKKPPLRWSGKTT